MVNGQTSLGNIRGAHITDGRNGDRCLGFERIDFFFLKNGIIKRVRKYKSQTKVRTELLSVVDTQKQSLAFRQLFLNNSLQTAGLRIAATV